MLQFSAFNVLAPRPDTGHFVGSMSLNEGQALLAG